MKFIYLFVVSVALSTPVLALEIDLHETTLPQMSDPGGMFEFGAQSNTVFVMEHFALSCSWCNSNAHYIKELAEEYEGDDRVQFLDIGSDQDDRSYARWIRAHNPPYPVLKDKNGEIYDVLHQRNGASQAWVLDCNGKFIGWIGEKYTDQHIRKLRGIIETAKETVCD